MCRAATGVSMRLLWPRIPGWNYLNQVRLAGAAFDHGAGTGTGGRQGQRNPLALRRVADALGPAQPCGLGHDTPPSFRGPLR
jgi:hypothetical protein